MNNVRVRTFECRSASSLDSYVNQFLAKPNIDSVVNIVFSIAYNSHEKDPIFSAMVIYTENKEIE